jgi:hypothetical protein
MSPQRIGLFALAIQLASASAALAQVPPPFVPPTPHFNSIDPRPATGLPVAPQVPVSPGLSSVPGYMAIEPASGAPIYTVPSSAKHQNKKTKIAQKTKGVHRPRHQLAPDDEYLRIMQ